VLIRRDIKHSALRKSFVRSMVTFNAEDNSLPPQYGNCGGSHSFSALQYRFLMSSELYEKEGLIGIVTYE
jgi:hypothetical protein